MRLTIVVLACCVLVSAHAGHQNSRVDPRFKATEKVRLILEATGMSNKDAYRLLGDAIHEHVQAVCPNNWKED